MPERLQAPRDRRGDKRGRIHIFVWRLQTESGTAALVSFVKSYQNSDYGLVPWRERAEVLRKGMVARVPPTRWSPDDGSAPK